jgi:hypothetical protein
MMPINGLSIANQNGKISLSGLCILLLMFVLVKLEQN